MPVFCGSKQGSIQNSLKVLRGVIRDEAVPQIMEAGESTSKNNKSNQEQKPGTSQWLQTRLVLIHSDNMQNMKCEYQIRHKPSGILK